MGLPETQNPRGQGVGSGTGADCKTDPSDKTTPAAVHLQRPRALYGASGLDAGYRDLGKGEGHGE